MATYAELRQLFGDTSLLARIEVALIIAANNLISGTPSTVESEWASKCFSNPFDEAKKCLMAVLAENNALTIAQITAASDTAIQSAVNDVVPVLVAANGGA